MARSSVIAGSALIIVASGLLLVQGQLAIRKQAFLIASDAKMQTAREKQPDIRQLKVNRDQYLVSSLAVAQELRGYTPSSRPHSSATAMSRRPS